jgi:hypothetical protein
MKLGVGLKYHIKPSVIHFKLFLLTLPYCINGNLLGAEIEG